MVLISTIILSILSGVLYHLGGSIQTKIRDLGVPSCMLVWVLLNGLWHWSIILCFGLMFAAQTTYFKKKGTDAQWYNWLLVGLAFSLSMFPYAITGHWVGLIYRTCVVTSFTVLWSEMMGKAWVEEGGRGFIQICTLPLILI